MGHIRESDWKVLRRLHPIALERYCARTIEECVEVASGADRSAHARYLALYRLIEARDKTLAMVFDDLRRSTAIATLIALAGLELLTASELDELSPETRETVQQALDPD